VICEWSINTNKQKSTEAAVVLTLAEASGDKGPIEEQRGVQQQQQGQDKPAVV